MELRLHDFELQSFLSQCFHQFKPRIVYSVQPISCPYQWLGGTYVQKSSDYICVLSNPTCLHSDFSFQAHQHSPEISIEVVISKIR